MKLKKKAYLLLSTLLFLASLSHVYVLGLTASSNFAIYIPTTSSLGFQHLSPGWVLLTVTSGAINSSDATISQTYRWGYFQFNPNETVTFTVTFSDLDVSVDKGKVDSGVSVTRTAGTAVTVTWEQTIFDPFEHYSMLGIGMFGFLMVGIGCFWGAKEVINPQIDYGTKMIHIGLALVFVILGSGLIIAWLW